MPPLCCALSADIFLLILGQNLGGGGGGGGGGAVVVAVVSAVVVLLAVLLTVLLPLLDVGVVVAFYAAAPCSTLSPEDSVCRC